MRLGTAFGAFLDPVADKLMVAATLVLLCTKPLECAVFREFHWLLTAPSIAIISREIAMSAAREWAALQNGRVLEAVAVNNLGKWKTATQMTSLTVLLASRDPRLKQQSVLIAFGVALLYASAGFAVWSLIVYTRNIWRVLPSSCLLVESATSIKRMNHTKRTVGILDVSLKILCVMNNIGLIAFEF
ncbi:cardiolipin synthase (CMP-forming)-like [Curcuma longa]|uniref:cardiolipin synthase (CMP-forming)-like n=1 Tax=Curcuma longa TaxID=136217 RepID=UPI003D9DCA3E